MSGAAGAKGPNEKGSGSSEPPVLDDADLTSLDDVRAEATSPSQAWRELAPDVRRDDDALARDVIEFIDDIAGFVAHGPQAFFESNASMPYLSTQMRIINMAHAVEAMSPAYRELIGLPELRQLVQMRHRLAHGYAHVSQEIVWVTATRDLEPMRSRLSQAVQEHQPDNG